MSRIYGQYQHRDWDVVDYKGFEIEGLPYALSGAKTENTDSGEYGVILGALQSFGVLVRKPFAHMITEEFNLPMLNLSVEGGAPQLYLNNRSVLEAYANAKFFIVQVLPALSSKNSYFETRGGKNMFHQPVHLCPMFPAIQFIMQCLKMNPQS